MAFQNKLTKQDIKNIADLIKIYIPEDQLENFRERLDTALDATKVFDELDLDDVEETSSSIGTINVFREDVAGQSLSQDQALQGAASTQNGLIIVQRVVRK